MHIYCAARKLWPCTSRAHSSHVRVHMLVSVNNIVWYCRLGSSNVSSIVFLKSEGMPRRLSAYARERVVWLWQQGKTSAQIVRELAKEDIVTTRRTVTRRIFRWTKDAGLEDQSRSMRPSMVTKKTAEFMDKWYIVLRSGPPFLQADVSI